MSANYASTSSSQEEHELYRQIEFYRSEVKRHEEELVSIEAELDEISDQREKYAVLAQVVSGLDKLEEMQAGSLFWEGLADDETKEQSLAKLRDQSSIFERKINNITARHEQTLKDIKFKKEEIEYLQDDLDTLRRREDEKKDFYVVEREITPLPYRMMVMPWTKQDKDEKKYRQILLLFLLYSILLGLLIPMYDVPIPDRAEVVEIPERLAKLIKKEKPKPPPKQKKVDQQKPKPTEKQKKAAKKKAAKTGLLALKNDFADLLKNMPEAKLGASADLSNAGSKARRTQRSIITSQATTGSGGVKSSSVSRSVGDGRAQVGGVAFTRVTSGIGTAVADDRPLSDGVGPSRTDEEIQIVFDRYKAALYRIYNRELRKNPTLKGKMVLRIRIEPDGSVSLCNVESTDLDSKSLSTRVVARVKRFQFGAKEGVPTITILYPIDFLPAY
ncbi:MAG: AgmX/PglI C-terminal domain-containing protein [Gammaproteobacteria bacterium]